jgi:hypothetical protein
VNVDDAERRLDGNAAAGLMTEIFAFDVTQATIVCAGCGATGPIAGLAVYGMAMGAILRCPGCDTAIVRIARLESGPWLDLRGTSVLRVAAT